MIAQPKSAAAFSLVELLVAVTIMLILAGTVGVAVWQWVPKARIARAESDIEAIKSAVEIYRADNFAPPTQRQGLAALVQKPSIPPIPQNWRAGGYLDSDGLASDPWGRPYIYLSPGPQGEPFAVFSYGADGAPGGEGEDADIGIRSTQAISLF